MKKNTLFIITALLLMFSLQSFAQLYPLVDDLVKFPAAGARTQYVDRIDISDFWVPAEVLSAAIVGTDSAWVFNWTSTFFNTADSGAIATDFAFSNEKATPSYGFADATVKDTLAFLADTTGGTFLVPVKYAGVFTGGGSILVTTANSDTIVAHASVTGNRTPVVLAGRRISTTPHRYLYIKYVAGAGNSAANRGHHTVMVPNPNGLPVPGKRY